MEMEKEISNPCNDCSGQGKKQATKKYLLQFLKV